MIPQRSLTPALAIALLACSSAPESTGTIAELISGGELAPDQNAVVAVVNFAGGHCSGSLIAPRLVLTARHCVADTSGPDQEVYCGQTPFVAADSAGALFVVALPEITDNPDDYRAVSAIKLSDPPDSDLCGADVALLILEQPLEGVTPLVPRLDNPALAGELFTAVGYGIDESLPGTPSGIRRELGGREVICSGTECGVPDIRSNEWLGTDAPCRGDSGGPALDADQQVIGVLSRGSEGCIQPVFGGVATRADWLRGEARSAAGKESPPAWACPSAEDCEAPSDLEETSCAVASPPRSTGGTAWLLTALALLASRARRRLRW
jgi:MYXO-CTERM domain-containing protein